jgi:hypothetical protein
MLRPPRSDYRPAMRWISSAFSLLLMLLCTANQHPSWGSLHRGQTYCTPAAQALQMPNTTLPQTWQNPPNLQYLNVCLWWIHPLRALRRIHRWQLILYQVHSKLLRISAAVPCSSTWSCQPPAETMNLFSTGVLRDCFAVHFLDTLHRRRTMFTAMSCTMDEVVRGVRQYMQNQQWHTAHMYRGRQLRKWKLNVPAVVVST